MNNIFQVFYELDKPLEKFPIFLQSIELWKDYVGKKGGSYKLYLRSDCERIIDNSKYKQFYYSLPLWSKLEFMRYVIVEQIGGLYIDLDIHPINYDIFYKLQQQEEYMFGLWDDSSNIPKYNNDRIDMSNSIMGFRNNSVITGFIEYAMKEHERMNLMPIYDKWRIRKMKRGVGVDAFKKYFKHYKINTELLSSIKDYTCKSWLVKKNKDLLYKI
jgi:mannosyltransferase OCH1-like enzyme